jgi:hypothetical protein
MFFILSTISQGGQGATVAALLVTRILRPIKLSHNSQKHVGQLGYSREGSDHTNLAGANTNSVPITSFIT